MELVKRIIKEAGLLIPPIANVVQLKNRLMVENNELLEEISQLNKKNQDLMPKAGHYAYFHYKTLPEPRYGWGKPPHEYLLKAIEKNKDKYAHYLNEFAAMKDFFASIKLTESENVDKTLPYWDNDLLPFIDAISICGFIKQVKPRKFIEIGSGNSTRFACYAASVFSPETQVISIDPYPGDTIQAFPNTFIKEGLEVTDLSIFDDLTENDIVWMDGSHHAFSNTDVSVFFMDVIPKLPKNMLIGIHDIAFPYDYHPGWNHYYLNEAIVLAAYLIGAGDRIDYTMPCFYVYSLANELRQILNPIWNLPQLAGSLTQEMGGGAFWFKKL